MFDTGTVLLEIFLFDFSGDLYGAALDVAFIGWIRPEMNFDSVEDLIRRMDQDCSQARHALARAPDAFPALGIVRLSTGALPRRTAPATHRAMNDKPPKRKSGERDYSQTLFLPQTDFPMRAGLPQKEPELLARWAEARPLPAAARGGEGPRRSSCCTTARPTPTATSTSATRSTRS